MFVSLVEILKLLGVTNEVDSEFSELACTFSSACDEISAYAFENGIMTKLGRLNSELYYGIRTCFGLKSQLTQSAMRAVVSRYEALETKMSEEFLTYETENGETFRFRKNLDWLTKPVRFLNPQVDLVRNRDFSFLGDGKVVSIATPTGRAKLRYSMRKDSRLFDPEWRIGGAKLLKRNGAWYLHVSMTKEVPDFETNETKRVVGVDMGLVNVATTNDGSTTEFFDGEAVRRTRDKYSKVRASLQKKGTKGAKRVLKRLSGRENGWMDDMNHRLSKALVSKYGSGTLFVLEDLSEISTGEKNLRSRTADGRRELRNWTFYDLRKKIEYKARLAGSEVLVVDPRFTSQRCPTCGNVDKSARDRSKHEYRCPKCGAVFNDDEAAAMNLHELGLRHLAGEKNPMFSRGKAKAKK